MPISKKRLTYAAAAAVGAAMIFTSTSAADWPQWRGANRDGRVTDFAVPKAWPKELAKKWSVEIGDGVATPAVVGDKVYVVSRQGSDEVTRCLNAETGEPVWQDKHPSQGISGPAQSFSGPRSSPAVADGKVVTLSVRGTVSCLDAASGKALWRKDEFSGAAPKFYTSSSPLIVDGMCVAILGSSDEGAIVAYDLAKGEQKWKWTGDGAAYASPVLMTLGDAKLIVAETSRKIVALSAADGKLMWETPFATSDRGGYNAATPVVEGQTIVYSGGSRGTHAVKLEKQGDKVSAKELWKNDEKSVQFNSPIVKDGMVYGITQGNELFCLSLADGKTLWAEQLGQAGGGAGGSGGRGPDGAAGQGERREGRGPGGGGGGRGRGGGGRGGYGSIVDAGQVLLALTPASELVVFQPSDRAFTHVAKIKVASTPTYAYPVLAGKQILIKDQNAVTAYSVE
jgi:outer membrane protein assembly factor BamB